MQSESASLFTADFLTTIIQALEKPAGIQPIIAHEKNSTPNIEADGMMLNAFSLVSAGAAEMSPLNKI